MKCFCFVFGPLQRKRLASNYLNTPLFLTARGRCLQAMAPLPGLPWGVGMGGPLLWACVGLPGLCAVGTDLFSGGWRIPAPGPSTPWPPSPRHLLGGGEAGRRSLLPSDRTQNRGSEPGR